MLEENQKTTKEVIIRRFYIYQKYVEVEQMQWNKDPKSKELYKSYTSIKKNKDEN